MCCARSRKKFSVVPAKAGTHYPEWQMLRDAGATACFNNAPLWLWVPAPVRNCVLGRDDISLRGSLRNLAKTPSSYHCCGRTTPPAFMPPSITSSVPVT